MIAVTGATGQLGQLVIDALLKTLPAAEVAAAVRNPAKARGLAARGVLVREADYDRPETLAHAFAGVDKLLLISSSEIGKRAAQHRAAIDAARHAGVKLLVYTSMLHADRSPLALAEEHRQTEALIRASGIPYVILRNGWYTENYTASIPSALAHGAHFGSAGEGRIASAARQDYAEAAAAVLIASEDMSGRIFELAGDEHYTLTQFAAEIARQSGKPIVYQDLPEADFKAALVNAGLPEPFAGVLADSDAGVAKGALDDDDHALRALIGRPTTSLATMVSKALDTA
ncbi:MAG: SDR family oxidoreductase [Salinibacterium sp.]|nr:MAG: SDR family oxidoreductase [Salinibacterium sp.]